jgi:hypothetical protein
MRRILVICLAALLIAASAALAATPRDGRFIAPKGQVDRGFALSFRVTARGTKVSGLVARVLETCSGMSTSRMVSVAPRATWTVRHGAFAARKKETRNGTTTYTTLTGTFTSPTRMTGTIRREAIVGKTRCDTYRVPFKARRG